MNTKYRVLVVDDMLVNLKMLEMILNSQGYETVLVSSGEEALERVKRENFHCILLDIVMPELDGFEVIRQLKMIPVVSDVPVIFITGEEGPEATVRGFEAGAVDYITKPFHPPEVQVRVRSHIKLYMTMQSLAQAQAETLKQINNAQNSLLKKPEDIPDAHFSVYYCSLHAAGGDIYDIIEIGTSKFAYFVGDFAGHQISTGFLTSSVKALLQQNCNDILSPSESMRMVNTVLCELMKPGQYLTGCYAVLDVKRGDLTVVNMGHPPLLVKQYDGEVVEVGKGGDVLGVFEDALYREDTIHLLPRDRFILYTDGLIEGDSVWSASTEKLRQKVKQIQETDRDEFLKELLVVSEEFRGEVTDDIMLLVADMPGEVDTIIKTENNGGLQLEFPSVSRYTTKVANDVYQWIALRIDVKDPYGLKLAINELLSNAVIHGNKEDYSKSVNVTVEIECVSIRIIVKDEGQGFDWRNHSDQSMEDPAAISGRGIALMKAYGFEVSYNERGNRGELKMGY